MNSKILSYTIILLLILTVSCNNTSKKQEKSQETKIKKDTVTVDSSKITKKEAEFKLTEENAIPFFFDYNKTLTENKVKITTNLGSFTLELFENVPYHRSNFIYLTKKGYFNDTYFHRVVKILLYKVVMPIILKQLRKEVKLADTYYRQTQKKDTNTIEALYLCLVVKMITHIN